MASTGSKCVHCLRSSNKMSHTNFRMSTKVWQTSQRTFLTKRSIIQQKHCLKNNSYISEGSSIKLLSPYCNFFHTQSCDLSKQNTSEPGDEVTRDNKGQDDDKVKNSNDQNISEFVSQAPPNVQPTQHVSIFKRFKDAYKEYGKVLIGVHIATSAVWYGGFFYAAKSGIDVVPLLEKLGASEKIIKPFAHSGAGNFAVAYLLYKIATPARYTVTIFGTQLTVKQFRKLGYMEKPAPEDSISNLMKAGRSQMRDKFDDIKDEMKDNVKGKMDEMKDNVKERMDGMKDNVKDRMDDVKDNVKGRVDKLTDKKPKR